MAMDLEAHGALPETVIFVPSLHCHSCVSHITALLTDPDSSFSTQIDPASVSVSLLSRTLSYYASAASPRKAHTLEQRVKSALRHAGHEVDDPYPRETAPRTSGCAGWFSFGSGRAEERRRRRHLQACRACSDALNNNASLEKGEKGGVEDTGASPPAGRVRTKFAVSGMTCSTCIQSLAHALRALPLVDPSSVRVSLMAAEAELVHSAALAADTLVEEVESVGFGAEVVESEPVAHEAQRTGVWQTVLEVGGMSCSSCSQSINSLLTNEPGIHSLTISVLSDSATVTHDPALISAGAIAALIEDAGFSSSVRSSVRVEGEGTRERGRSVEVQVEGMYCEECPLAILHTLRALPLLIHTAPTLSRPTMQLAYLPTPHSHPPRTLRSFLSTLRAAHPRFTFTPLAPPSPASRAHALHKAEERAWAIRVALAAGSAVPAFVVSVVGQALLPERNGFRTYWDERVWGGAGRGAVAMWALATPVQFGVGIFYKRSYHSLRGTVRTLTRPRAKSAPFPWRSLLAWGSMDLLVALGTTVAYFASLAMLILDVRAGMSSKKPMMGYFEMVIFLIFFISLGRLLESWAKTKTGDAIAMLGALKSERGLLLEEDAEGAGGEVDAEPKETEKPSTSDVLLRASSSTASDKPSSVAPPLPILPENPSLSQPSPLLPSRTSSPAPVPLILLEEGDHILLSAGSLPPADGVILRGSSTFDESSLTGESRPVAKRAGDAVFTGTTNLGAPVVLRVTAVGGETMIDRIVRIVAEAQGRKAPIEKLADAIAGVFVPAIVAIALVTLVVWLAVAVSVDTLDGKTDRGDKIFFAIQFAIAALVIACPCGIGLAAPTAQAVGSGLAAKYGVLAHGGGEAFQAATQVDCVVFDKTGTLTTGDLTVTDETILLPDISAEVAAPLWSALAQLEDGSTHPLAQAVRATARARLASLASVPFPRLLSSEEVPGRGVMGVFQCVDTAGKIEVRVGNEQFMDGAAPLHPRTTTLLDTWKGDGKSVVLVSVRALQPSAPSTSGFTPLEGQSTVAFVLAVADAPRPEAASTVSALRSSGKAVWMLSGDNAITARTVARQVGIEDAHVIADVLPAEKAERIQWLQAHAGIKTGAAGRRLGRWFTRRKGKAERETRALVLFCGDGLNDAAAIAMADVGVAMGTGSQVSVSSAHFILLHSTLSSLLTLLSLSRKVKCRIALNFAWACIFNVAAIPLAAGVFYPLGVRLPPVYSALAMALSSVSVVGSSLALRLFRPPQ